MAHKPRSNTKAIKAFQAYLASKGKAPAKPVDVYRGAWWPHTTPVQSSQEPAEEAVPESNERTR